MSQAAESLGPGITVAKRFTLERIVGEGAMGVVWAATELSSQRRVALKFLSTTQATDPRMYERFMREARASMAVRHPNVAPVSEVGETERGAPFLVMDLLQGESLGKRLQRQHRLPFPEAASMLCAVIDAVAAAHRVGIVHRDLKPENIFLTPEGVRVLDFGIAKRVGSVDEMTLEASLTATGALIGTPYYMAPEQIFGDADVDARADVWAIGIIAYECLAGVLPTQGSGLGQVLKIVATDQIRPLGEVAPDLDSEIARLVMSMLSRDRNRRPTLEAVRRMFDGHSATLDGSAPKTIADGAPGPPQWAPAERPASTLRSAPPVANAGSAPPVGATHATRHQMAAPPPRPASAGSRGNGVAVAVAVASGVAALLVLAAGGAIVGYFNTHVARSVPARDPTPGLVHTPPPPEALRARKAGLAGAQSPTTEAPPAASSARPLGPATTTGKPTSPALPTATQAPQLQRHTEWEAFHGGHAYVGAPTLAAVDKLLPTLRSCFPAPADDAMWTSSFEITWPVGSLRTSRFVVRKNGIDDTSPAGAGIRACMEGKAAAWQLPPADRTGATPKDVSYVRGFAGFVHRPGRPP